jgi:hypothetical protein
MLAQRNSASSNSSSDIDLSLVCFPSASRRKTRRPVLPLDDASVEAAEVNAAPSAAEKKSSKAAAKASIRDSVTVKPEEKQPIVRRTSTKKREIVQEGHDYLRNASDLMFQHRNTLVQDVREFDSRWAEYALS